MNILQFPQALLLPIKSLAVVGGRFFQTAVTSASGGAGGAEGRFCQRVWVWVLGPGDVFGSWGARAVKREVGR